MNYRVEVPKDLRRVEVNHTGKIEWVRPDGTKFAEDEFDEKNSQPGDKGLMNFSILFTVREDVKMWLDENCGPHKYDDGHIYFERERDAVLFKTFWC